MALLMHVMVHTHFAGIYRHAGVLGGMGACTYLSSYRSYPEVSNFDIPVSFQQ